MSSWILLSSRFKLYNTKSMSSRYLFIDNWTLCFFSMYCMPSRIILYDWFYSCYRNMCCWLLVSRRFDHKHGKCLCCRNILSFNRIKIKCRMYHMTFRICMCFYCYDSTSYMSCRNIWTSCWLIYFMYNMYSRLFLCSRSLSTYCLRNRILFSCRSKR